MITYPLSTVGNSEEVSTNYSTDLNILDKQTRRIGHRLRADVIDQGVDDNRGGAGATPKLLLASGHVRNHGAVMSWGLKVQFDGPASEHTLEAI